MARKARVPGTAKATSSGSHPTVSSAALNSSAPLQAPEGKERRRMEDVEGVRGDAGLLVAAK